MKDPISHVPPTMKLTLKNPTVTWYVNGVDVKGVTNFDIDDSQFTKVKNWRTQLRMTEISPELAGEIKCSYECGIGPPVTSKIILKSRLLFYRQ